MKCSKSWYSVLCAEDALDGVAGDGVEEEKEEDGQQSDEDDLDDGPLVIVPDDVADGLQGVQKPHEAGVRPDRLLQAIWIFSAVTSGILFSLLRR